MALATDPDRTILVVRGPQQLPSDVSGRHYIQLRGPADLKELAQRLETAGCPVDLTGSDWLDASRFPALDHVESTPTAERQDGLLSDEQRRAYAALLTAHGQLAQVSQQPDREFTMARFARPALNSNRLRVKL